MMTWNEAMCTAIYSIPFAPYGAGGSGTTKDIVWRGKKILDAKKPVTSYCSGAQFEAFIDAIKILGLEHDDRFDNDVIRELRLGAYCRVDEGDQYRDGLPGSLIRLGLGVEVAAEDAQYGDLIEMQFDHLSPKHAIIASDKNSCLHDHDMRTVTEHLNPNESSLIIWAWGSNYRQPKDAYGMPTRPAGHMQDYFKLTKPGRTYKVARPTW